MAIYHLNAQVISRSQGRSAVACAAYRSAEKLYDERYQKEHDYRKKQDVAHSEILLPNNAPQWMSQREKLWNAVETAEKRKDSQLSREVQFALPRELTQAQNIALAKEFVQNEFVHKGMVADLNIHLDKTPGGESQPHAHVMLTLREVTPEGFGQKVREWNRTDQLLDWRESWANTANRHLALHDVEIRIDHRSNAEQGIALEPQHKIGTSIMQERMARLADHERIARENGEQILKDPNIAFDAITRQQSTFTHQDLARFVNRHTADAEQFQTVYDIVKVNDQLILLGQDDKGLERFTTQDMLAIETQLMVQAIHLQEQPGHGVSAHHQAHALNSRSLTAEQQIAFDHLTDKGDIKCVIGYAGTGKSYLLGAAREAWEGQGYQVSGVTLSGIAAENLAGSSGIESRTLASRFYQWDKGRETLSARDVLVVDEAGMIGSRQMAKLIDHAHTQGAKVVLIGDPEQLQAIEAGAAFRAISEQTGYVELTDIRRQRDAWQQEATKELATGKTVDAVARYTAHDHTHMFPTQAQAKQGMVALWNDVRINAPDKTQIMLAYTKADVQELNERARLLRHEQGELGQDHTVETARGNRNFAQHDRIYFLKNERSLGVMNGTLGTVESIQNKHHLQVRLDSQEPNQPGKIISIDTRDYHHLDHGYAATVHKSQGVTVDRSYLLASKYLDAHVTYVGMSRHRDSAELFWSRDTFENEKKLAQSLGRDRSKDVTIDYLNGKNEKHHQKEITKIEKEPSLSLKTASTKEHSIQAGKDVVDARSPLREEQLRAAAQAYDRLYNNHQSFNKGPGARDPLQDFKAQFEARNPEQAKQLRDAVRPLHERHALAAEKQIGELEKNLQESHSPNKAKADLQKYMVNVGKQPEVMNYLKEHNKELAQRIHEVTKSHTRQLDRGISR